MRAILFVLAGMVVLACTALALFAIQYYDPVAVQERTATAAIRIQQQERLAALSIEHASRATQNQTPPVEGGTLVLGICTLILVGGAVWVWMQFGCYVHMALRRRVGLITTDTAGRLPVTLETVVQTDFPQETIRAYHATQLVEASRPVLLPPAYMRYTAPAAQPVNQPQNQPAAPVLDVLMHADAVALYGSRGSGKTSLLQNWIAALLAAGYRVIVYDPHDAPGKWAALCEVSGGNRDFAAILRGVDLLAAEMHRRSGLLARGHATEEDFQRDAWFFLFDEFAAAMNECDRDMEQAVTRKVRACLMESRKFGLFPCFVVQSKNARFLGVQGAADLKAGMLFVRLDKDAQGVRRCYVSRGDEPEREAQLPLPPPSVYNRPVVSHMPAGHTITGRYEVLPDEDMDMVALSPTTTPTTTPQNVLPCPVGAESVAVVGEVGAQAEPGDPREAQARALLASGVSLSATALQVYGNAAGAAFRKVQAIKRGMDAEG